MCKFRHELLSRKSGQSITQIKNVSKGTVRSQKSDNRRNRFGENNETTEENNQERERIETTQRQHSATTVVKCAKKRVRLVKN